MAAASRTKPIRRWRARPTPLSASRRRGKREARWSAARPCGEPARPDVRVEPAGEWLAGLDRIPDALFRLRTLKPGPRFPVSPCHQSLAPQELAARVIGRVSGWHALEARLGDLVAILDERGDDPGQFFAVLAGDRIAKASELIGGHLMSADRHVEPVVRDLEIKPARPAAGQIGAEMLLIWALVGREAQVAVEAEDLDLQIRPQVSLELGKERFHRLAHLLFVHRSVGFEKGLAVVTLQAAKELQRRLRPPLETHANRGLRLGGHRFPPGESGRRI